eukprot:gene47725-58466_t
MVWIAILYAALGTWLAHLIGRRLTRLNFNQQKVEADFRYALVRFRDSTEGVALHRGEAEERGALVARFRALMENWWALMVATKRLTFFTAGYSQVATVFPFVVAAPAFFAGRIPLGGLTQTAQAFGEVQGALSRIVDNYASLTEWRATVTRLIGFRDALEAARAAAQDGDGIRSEGGAPGVLRLSNLHLRLPDGRVLLEDASLELRAGERVLLTGASGSGKSTLLKSIAGFIQPCEGEIRLLGQKVEQPGPDRIVVFQEFDQLPPWKTVKQNVMFPLLASGTLGKREAAERALYYLDKVGLGKFADAYPHTLSGGMK